MRAEEATIRSKQDDNNKAIAEASIAASLQDRASERDHQASKTKTFFVGGGAIVLLFLIFMGFALYIEKDAVVIKILELIALFIAGFFSGYGIKSFRDKDKSNPPE